MYDFLWFLADAEWLLTEYGFGSVHANYGDGNLHGDTSGGTYGDGQYLGIPDGDPKGVGDDSYV